METTRSSKSSSPRYGFAALLSATWRGIILTVWTILPIVSLSLQDIGPLEYCTSEKFEAKCLQGEIILIKRAVYGRMGPGRCISAEYAHSMGCYADVTAYLDELCSGRQNCSSHVGTLDSVAQPCSIDFKAYLEASYKCVKVSYVDDCTNRNVSLLTDSSGYVALRSRTGHWNSVCPWTVRTEPGRLINISGVNFGAIREQKGPYLHKITPCPFYVAFSEADHSKTQRSLCYIDHKLHVIYNSHSNVVQVKLMITKSEIDVWKKFRPVILHYNVYGCVDLTPPEGSYVERKGDNVLVVCNDTQEKWYLTCKDGSWNGEMANCTKALDMIRTATIESNTPAHFHNGLILAVLIGVILGVVVGGFMLFVIFLMRKSRRVRRQNRPEETQYESRMRVDDNCSYPALLCQEKPCGTHVCEYTHVWNMHPSSMAYTEGPYTCDRNPKSKPDILKGDRDRQKSTVEVERISMTNFTMQETRLKEPLGGCYDLDTTNGTVSIPGNPSRNSSSVTLPRNVTCPRVHMEPALEPL